MQPSSSSDEELSDSGDTENIPNHSTTKKKRSEFDWCCCSLFFIFQISPTYSFIGKKSSKSTNVRKRRKQRKAASARVSKSPIVELSIAMVVPHKKRAQAIITNLTASNAMAKEEAIEERHLGAFSLSLNERDIRPRFISLFDTFTKPIVNSVRLKIF